MARKQRQSPLHILEPVDLKMVFSRAMVYKDLRMAKYVCSFFPPCIFYIEYPCYRNVSCVAH